MGAWVFRGRPRRVTAAVVALTLALAGLVIVLGAPASHAADRDFLIDDFRILADASPGDGLCRTSQSTCTLRAAIQEANSNPALTTNVRTSTP